MNHITLAVKDLEQSFSFYKDVLGLEALCKWKKGAYFLAGDFWFCLNSDRDANPAKGCTHLSFSVTEEDFDTFQDRIREAKCKTWKENTSEGLSLYFEDLDGHKLEIHVGDWKTRLKDIESSNLDGLEFY